MSECANTRVGDKSSLQQCVHLHVAEGRDGSVSRVWQMCPGDSMSICYAHHRGECLYQPPENLKTLRGRKAFCIWPEAGMWNPSNQ